MYTANPRPGKFEGNASQWAAEVAYAASLDGAESTGDCVDYGLFCALVPGRRWHALVWEDAQGFVQVDWHAPDVARFLFDAFGAQCYADYEA